MEKLKKKFNYWNERGKSAICRFILDKLGITLTDFAFHCSNFQERKLIEEDGEYKVIIKATSGYLDPKYTIQKK
jgi:hypothetical protein